LLALSDRLESYFNPLISDRLGIITANPEEVSGYLRGFALGAGSFASIVLAADGSYRDGAGGSDELSSPLDRAWLRALRGRADVIITSGATVRAERLAQPSKDFLVASKSGDLSGLRHGDGHLFIASDADSHESWPQRAQHFGSYASTAEIVSEARNRWQNPQVEFGAPTLAELARIGLLDRLFVSAPTESAVVRRFGHGQRLFSIDNLTVFAIENPNT